MSRGLLSHSLVAVPKKNFADGACRSFSGRVGSRTLKGFVVRRGEKFYAYLNLCRHLPIALDLDDNQFFNHDKTRLQCHMHGALYEIETGLCVEGPCEGARLVALEIAEEETRLVITLRDAAD